MECFKVLLLTYTQTQKRFQGIFVQDMFMKEAFRAYPEFICLDATYKLFELCCAVYVIICEDSNGQTEVVALCLLVSEDENSIKWMMNTFKVRNSESDNIRVIMADKNIVERQVIKQCLPHAVILICLFHTLRSMRREITAEKLGITAAQRPLIGKTSKTCICIIRCRI